MLSGRTAIEDVGFGEFLSLTCDRSGLRLLIIHPAPPERVRRGTAGGMGGGPQ